MIGVSSVKKEESSNIIRRPSIIVMNYLQEFGYRVIPINPFSAGKKINGELVFEKLEDVKTWLPTHMSSYVSFVIIGIKIKASIQKVMFRKIKIQHFFNERRN